MGKLYQRGVFGGSRPKKRYGNSVAIAILYYGRGGCFEFGGADVCTAASLCRHLLLLPSSMVHPTVYGTSYGVWYILWYGTSYCVWYIPWCMVHPMVCGTFWCATTNAVCLALYPMVFLCYWSHTLYMVCIVGNTSHSVLLKYGEVVPSHYCRYNYMGGR